MRILPENRFTRFGMRFKSTPHRRLEEARAIILSEIASALSESCSRTGARFHDIIRMHFRLSIASAKYPQLQRKTASSYVVPPSYFHVGDRFAKKAAIPSVA